MWSTYKINATGKHLFSSIDIGGCCPPHIFCIPLELSLEIEVLCIELKTSASSAVWIEVSVLVSLVVGVTSVEIWLTPFDGS